MKMGGPRHTVTLLGLVDITGFTARILFLFGFGRLVQMRQLRTSLGLILGTTIVSNTALLGFLFIDESIPWPPKPSASVCPRWHHLLKGDRAGAAMELDCSSKLDARRKVERQRDRVLL